MNVLELLNKQRLGIAEWAPILEACKEHAKAHSIGHVYNCLDDFETDYNYVWYTKSPGSGKTKIV